MVCVVLRPCHLDALAVLVNFLFPVLSPDHLCSLSLVTEAHLHPEQNKVRSGGKACVLRIGGLALLAMAGQSSGPHAALQALTSLLLLRVWFFQLVKETW